MDSQVYLPSDPEQVHTWRLSASQYHTRRSLKTTGHWWGDEHGIGAHTKHLHLQTQPRKNSSRSPSQHHEPSPAPDASRCPRACALTGCLSGPCRGPFLAPCCVPGPCPSPAPCPCSRQELVNITACLLQAGAAEQHCMLAAGRSCWMMLHPCCPGVMAAVMWFGGQRHASCLECTACSPLDPW